MNKRSLLCYFGAVLLASAAPAVSGTPSPAAAQTTVKKKKTVTSKSRKKSKPKTQMAPTPDRIREIQSALQQQGTYHGDPSGKWDDSTVEAMKNYQDKSGLTPTGKIDALTLEKLGLGSETAGKGAPVPPVSSSKPASNSIQ